VTFRCGLIGAGIQGSRAPALHRAEAAAQGASLEYHVIDLDQLGVGIEALPQLLERAVREGYCGLNITYPCKQAVIPCLHALSEEARAIGAVNTITIQDGRLTGHNTDGPGWASGFRRALPQADLSRVALVGCGGAGAACADALLRLGARALRFYDIDPRRAVDLASRLQGFFPGSSCVAEGKIEDALRRATGVVHASPVGMAKMPGMALPKSLLRPDLWVSEVVYVPLETELLKAARAAGCRVMDGGHMNVGQAVRAFRLFTGLEADAARMEKHFRSL
jgi:shikimate dehydrogenase